MPRRLRLPTIDIPVHAYHRGNNHGACFVDPHDRGRYLGLLQELAHALDVDVHAFVLMTNHVHLLLTNRRLGAISKLMKGLSQRYAQHFNAKHGRTGTLWEGRFHASVVDSEAYLFNMYRYIEANPVRAGMVAAPADYPWSSHAVNAYGAASALVEPHPLYLQIGRDAPERLAAYRGMFDEDLSDDELEVIRKAIRGSFALGKADFISALEQRFKRRFAARRAGRHFKDERGSVTEPWRLVEVASPGTVEPL